MSDLLTATDDETEATAPSTSKAEPAPIPEAKTGRSGSATWDKLIDSAVENLGASTKLSDHADRVGRSFADFASGLMSREMPKPPPVVSLAPPPTPSITSPLEAFGSPAATLAIFGSMLTRAPLTTALKAGAQAINATREGDYGAYKRGFEAWESQTDHALRVSKLEGERYANILKAQGHSDDQKLNLIKAEAALLKDDVLMRVAQTGSIRAVSDLLYKRDLLANQADKSANGVKTDMAVFQQIVAADEEKLGRALDADELAARWTQVKAKGGQGVDKLTAAWQIYKKENPDGTWQEFVPVFQSLHGKLSPEQVIEGKRLDREAALERVDRQQAGASQRTAATQAGATERANIRAAARNEINTAHAFFAEKYPDKAGDMDAFDQWYVNVHGKGRITAPQREAIEDKKLEAAQVRKETPAAPSQAQLASSYQRAGSQAVSEARAYQFASEADRSAWIDARTAQLVQATRPTARPAAQTADADAPPSPLLTPPPSGAPPAGATPTIRVDTPSSEQKAQRDIMTNSQLTIENIDRVLGRFEQESPILGMPPTTGVGGLIQRGYNATVGAVTGSNLDKFDSDTIAALAAVKSDIQKALKVDSNMSIAERHDLERISESLDGLRGRETVIASLQEARRILDQRKTMAAQRLGLPVTRSAPGAGSGGGDRVRAISTMPQDQLMGLDPKSMSPAELRAAAARWEELGRGR